MTSDKALAELTIDAFMRRNSVEKLTGISSSTIYRLMADGNFPKPYRLAENSVGWKASEISAWVNARQRVA